MRYGRYVGVAALLVILFKLCAVAVKFYLRYQRSEERAAKERPMSDPAPLMSDEQAAMMRESDARMREMQSRMSADMEAVRQRNQQMMDEMRNRQPGMGMRPGF